MVFSILSFPWNSFNFIHAYIYREKKANLYDIHSLIETDWAIHGGVSLQSCCFLASIAVPACTFHSSLWCSLMLRQFRSGIFVRNRIRESEKIILTCMVNNPNCYYPVHGGFTTTVVWFYSLISQSYVNLLKFRSAFYSVRCSTWVVAISQAAQVMLALVTGRVCK